MTTITAREARMPRSFLNVLIVFCTAFWLTEFTSKVIVLACLTMLVHLDANSPVFLGDIKDDRFTQSAEEVRVFRDGDLDLVPDASRKIECLCVIAVSIDAGWDRLLCTV